MPKTLVQNRTASVALARTEQDLVRLASAWKHDSRGEIYIRALTGWLSSLRSPNTARSYRFALAEFADWYEMKRGRSFVPHLVTTTDANLYAQYLFTRTEGLEEIRLKRDGKLLELAIWRAAKRRPGSTIAELRTAIMGQLGVETASVERDGQHVTVLAIEKDDFYGFDKLLANMVDHKLLSRTPSVRELREIDKSVGFHERPDPSVFRYSIAVRYRYAPGERASTLDARLSALSSFWRYMIERGENLPGYEQPVKINIWAPLKRDFSSRAREQKKLARAATMTDQETFDRLLSTTDGSRRLRDLRDRAAMLMFYWTGMRADELGRAKRADVSWPAEAGRPATIRVLGKGQKLRQFRIPPVAFQSLVDLSIKLDELARVEETRDEGALPRARILLSGDSPLLPSLGRWGVNSARKPGFTEQDIVTDLKVGLSRSAWNMMLQSRAEEAGIDRGSAQFRRAHPHGIRHLAVRSAIERKVGLPTIQATVGHASLDTTGTYSEVYDPAATGLDMSPGAASASTPVVGATVARTGVVSDMAPEVEIEEPEDNGEVAVEPFEGPLWAYEAGSSEDRKMLVRGSTPEHLQALAMVRVGETSRLAWWGGPANHLDPAMPVLAPQQTLGVWPERDVLMRGLSDLYGSWLLSKGQHGPTSAAALVWWVNEALEVTEQVDDHLMAIDARWFPFPTPDGDPAYDPKGLRAHDPEYVVDWFRVHGWRYAKTRKTMRLDDEAPKEPTWFRDEDPVASLPDEERDEALAWLSAITGQVEPGSPEAGREVLLQMLVEMSRLGDEPARQRSEHDTVYMNRIAKEAAKTMQAAGIKTTAEDLLKADAVRREKTAASRAGSGEKTQSREAFWGGYVRRVWPDVEPVQAVLSDYRDLLRIDPEARTVVHEPELQAEFARTIGGHSECVARRIARYLWELHKQDVAAKTAGEKRPRAAERADDLVRDVQSMRYLLSPCSSAQETELQERVKALSDGPRTLDAVMKRHAAIIRGQRELAAKVASRPRDFVRELEVAKELREAERAGASLSGPAQASAGHLVPNARTLMRLVPSPIALIFAARA